MVDKKKLAEYMHDKSKISKREPFLTRAFSYEAIAIGFFATGNAFSQSSQSFPNNTILPILTNMSYFGSAVFSAAAIYQATQAYQQHKKQSEIEQLIIDNFELVLDHEPHFKENIPGMPTSKFEYAARIALDKLDLELYRQERLISAFDSGLTEKILEKPNGKLN